LLAPPHQNRFRTTQAVQEKVEDVNVHQLQQASTAKRTPINLRQDNADLASNDIHVSMSSISSSHRPFPQFAQYRASPGSYRLTHLSIHRPQIHRHGRRLRYLFSFRFLVLLVLDSSSVRLKQACRYLINSSPLDLYRQTRGGYSSASVQSACRNQCTAVSRDPSSMSSWRNSTLMKERRFRCSTPHLPVQMSSEHYSPSKSRRSAENRAVSAHWQNLCFLMELICDQKTGPYSTSISGNKIPVRSLLVSRHQLVLLWTRKRQHRIVPER
jgi:hypothetical protein